MTMRRSLLLLAGMVLHSACLMAGNFSGWWCGKIAVLPVVIHIEQQADRYSGCLYSPTQTTDSLAFTRIDVNGDSLSFAIDPLAITYSGVLTDGPVIKGTYRQNGRSFRLEMQPGEASDAKANRPQTPRPPFIYNSENVTFSNDSLRFGATMTSPWMPTAGGVVLVSGSGRQNRDEEILGHKPFAVIADFLTRQGWTVLRYDDRGAGESSPGSPDDTTLDFADDAMAAADYLRSLPSLADKPVGIIGHSEGGTIAMIDAAEHPDKVDFVVSLAGMAVKGRDLMIRQNEMIYELSGQQMPEADNRRVRDIFAIIDTASTTAAMAASIDSLMTPAQPDPNMRATAVSVMTDPWYVGFVRLDPSPYIKKIRCPLLAVNGTWDVQVDAAMNLGAIGSLLPSATLRSMPGLNHFMQAAPTKAQSFDYGSISRTIEPEVLDAIGNFLIEVTGNFMSGK